MLLSALLLVCLFPASAIAGADSLVVDKPVVVNDNKFIDRLAVRTNAVDWVLTVPNIAVEFDLTGSQYNNMTVGVSAKYNWDTYHTYSPPMLFNLLDVRPEFRYYYRTRHKQSTTEKWSLDWFLKDRKHPKEWRASYVGAYANYGSYAFKFTEKGMQGHVIGLGATAGYSVPMYEYKNGAVDVELGFSVGLQVCSRDMFVHNPDSYTYTSVVEGSKGMHLTPFPVVSDVRVAFVWRHKSIKDKVKRDLDKERVKAYYIEKELEKQYNHDSLYTDRSAYELKLKDHDKGFISAITGEWMITDSTKRMAIMANDSLYFGGYCQILDEEEQNLMDQIPNAFPAELKEDSRVYEIVRQYEGKLIEMIQNNKKKAIKKFKEAWMESEKGQQIKKEKQPEKKKEKKSDKKKEQE